MRSFIIMALCLFTSSTATAETKLKMFSHRLPDGWTLSAFRFENSKTFSHCSIDTLYTAADAAARKLMQANTMVLVLMADNKGGMSFGLQSSEWKITEHKPYRVQIAFTKTTAEHEIILKGIPNGGMIVSFQLSNWEWLKKMMINPTMYLWINDNYIGKFGLRGSRQAIGKLFECVTQHGGEVSPAVASGKHEEDY